MSHIPSVTSRTLPQWQIPSKHFPSLPIFVKVFHSQYSLKAVVIQMQYLLSQICVHIHIFFTILRRWSGKGINKSWTTVNECKGKFFPCHFGNSCHFIGNPGLGFNCRTHAVLIIPYLPLKIELRICWTYGRWNDCIPFVGNLNTQV